MTLTLLQQQLTQSNMEGDQISSEERKRLDRQRFIGWQTQKKLLSSRVLITPANGPNTELAKNLILAGVNVTIYDDAVATEDDFESNFLVAERDIGKNRGDAVFGRLKQMNPSGKNELVIKNLIDNLEHYPEEQFRRYTMIVTSTGNFDLMKKWDILTKKLNLPYYNLVCCGLFSFAFISLGAEYTYKTIDKQKNVSQEWSIQSLAVGEALDSQKADRLKEFIGAIQMMAESQKQGLSYDPFNPNDDILTQIVQIGVEIAGEKHKEFLTTFAKTYNIDFCPVYSVLGSIISQEVITIVGKQNEPGMNWLVFNSEQGYSNIVKISDQMGRIVERVTQQ